MFRFSFIGLTCEDFNWQCTGFVFCLKILDQVLNMILTRLELVYSLPRNKIFALHNHFETGQISVPKFNLEENFMAQKLFWTKSSTNNNYILDYTVKITSDGLNIGSKHFRDYR